MKHCRRESVLFFLDTSLVSLPVLPQGCCLSAQTNYNHYFCLPLVLLLWQLTVNHTAFSSIRTNLINCWHECNIILK